MVSFFCSNFSTTSAVIIRPSNYVLSLVAAITLLRPEPGQHRYHRTKGDETVDPERKILDVVEIVMELAANSANIGDMPLHHLPPPSPARANDLPLALKGASAFIPSDRTPAASGTPVPAPATPTA